MENSKAFLAFKKQIDATGTMKKEGYDLSLFSKAYDWERKDAETIIWQSFYKNGDADLLAFFPELKFYDGISALKTMLWSEKTTEGLRLLIAFYLYQSSGEKEIIEIIKDIITNRNFNYSDISLLIHLNKSKEVYDLFKYIYKKATDKIEVSCAITGLLYNKGYIRDIDDVEELSNNSSIRKRMKSLDVSEREEIIQKFERGEFDAFIE